jgi:hypothetical protein
MDIGEDVKMWTSPLVIGAALALVSFENQSAPPTSALCLERLAGMSWCELEQLYRSATPSSVPCGFVRGRAIYSPCEKGSAARSKVTNTVWRGKIFDPDHCSMVNQWRGFRAIHAQVYEGTSWLDGKPSIILDYTTTSRVWSDVRDEIREVAPGVWLGVMYRIRCPEPQLKTFFALESPCCLQSVPACCGATKP